MFIPYKLHHDLLLGVATAATQIEGGDNTNTNWYRFSLTIGNVKDGSSPLRADNHYELYEEDAKLMKDLNIQIYRMGIEWGRIEPEKDKFNDEAMKHYINEIKLLQSYGIKVLLTLHHFSNPLWFEDIGGWLDENNIKYFLNFVRYVVNNLKGIVDEYVTINEANIYASNSYLFGVWYPMHKNMKEAGLVMRHLCLAHIYSYKIIKEINPNTKVGFANHMAGFKPARKHNIIDKFVARFMDNAFNNSINRAMAYGKFSYPMGKIKGLKGEYIDFFGINYYTGNLVRGTKLETKKDCPHNDLGWEIDPILFNEFIEKFHKEFNKPIYITENGTADKADSFRAKYIYDHLKVIADKEYVKRYYHWTFMDNWEWAEGEAARFGLVEVNYETQERKIRPSGYFYKDIIDNKGITEDSINKYLNK